MNDKYTLEPQFNVWDDEEGVGLSVRQDPDGGDWVSIYPNGEKSQKWYGEFNLVIPPGMARLLAQAITKIADESEKGTK